MNIILIIRLLLSLAQMLAQRARDKGLIEQGRAEELLKNLKASNDAINKASAARADAERKFDESGGVPDDNDPHLRD